MVDVVVVGLGGMGSAALAELASRGTRVVGLEQFGAAHALGSSHGESRIVRRAYFESPDYVPLLHRAYTLWDRLPESLGIRRVGCLSIGMTGSAVLEGAERTAREHGIAVQLLDPADCRTRFPHLRLRPGDAAVWEPDAGFVRPEATVAHHLEVARALGADVRLHTTVTALDIRGDGVGVRLDDGSVLDAAHAVVTAGPWVSRLLPGLPVRVERRVQHFYRPGPGFPPEPMPTFIWELAPDDAVYGFPPEGGHGFKIGFHHRGGSADPDDPQRAASSAEAAQMDAVVTDRFVGVGRRERSIGCLYSRSPDDHFLIGPAGPHPDRLTVAAGFSGHGFKFVPVVGEILADLAVTGQTAHPIGFCSPTRFG